MKENLLTILIIILFGILVSDLLAIFQLWKINRKISKQTSDSEKYFDLKLRIHSLQITITLATFLVFFLGWNVKQQIIDTITHDISVQIKPIQLEIDSLHIKYDSLNSNLSHKIKEINKLKREYDKLTNDYIHLGKLLKSKLEYLKTILNIYLIPDIELSATKLQKRIYFNKLKPVNADKLPEFAQPPFVIIQTNWGLGFSIKEITKDYIEFSEVNVMSDFKKGKYSLWIVPRDK